MNGTGLCASTLKRTAPQWQEPSRCMAEVRRADRVTKVDTIDDAYTAAGAQHRLHRRRQHGAGPRRRPRQGRPPGRLDHRHRAERRNAAPPGRPVRRQRALGAPGRSLEMAEIVVWAVKPQTFEIAAARRARGHVAGALQVSVMAGVRSDAIVAATGSERVVRVMPNTPALIGQGIAGLFARAAVTDEDRADAIALLAPTGELIWVGEEAAARRRDGAVGLGPGLRLPAARGAARGRAADGACRRPWRAASPSRPSPARPRSPPRRPTRPPSCAASSPRPAARPRRRWPCSRRAARATPSSPPCWPRAPRPRRSASPRSPPRSTLLPPSP